MYSETDLTRKTPDPLCNLEKTACSPRILIRQYRMAKISNRVILAHIALFCANIFWGANSPVTKSVLETGLLDGLTLSAVRIGGATLLFVLLGFILPRNIAPRERIARKDLHLVFIASLLMITVNQALYIIGIEYTSPVDSGIMSSVTPVFTLICAAIFLRYPVTWVKGAGVSLGLGGAVMMVLAGGGVSAVASNPVFGDSLCLVAQLGAALYYVLFKGLIDRYAPFTLMKWMFIFSTLTYVLVLTPRLCEVDFASFTPMIWADIAYIIVFATFAGYLIIPFSQKYLRPTAVSMYSYFQPVTACVLAAVMGYADFGPLKIIATFLIFAGVFIVSRQK